MRVSPMESTGGLLVGLEAGVDDLADEEGVAAELHLLADLAVDPGHRELEDRARR